MNFFGDPSYSSLFDSVEAVKARRDDFIAELESGSLSLSEAFDKAWSEPVLAVMKVLPVVEALPETGKVSTRRAFGEVEISESALTREVSALQVEALPAAIERHTI